MTLYCQYLGIKNLFYEKKCDFYIHVRSKYKPHCFPTCLCYKNIHSLHRVWCVRNTFFYFEIVFSFSTRVSYNRADWKRDQTIADDSLTHGRYGPPLAVTIRFCTVVLLFSRNCRVIEGKRATTRWRFADDTIASEFETRWFSHFLPHSGARNRKSNEYRDKLSRCKNCWNNAFDI